MRKTPAPIATRHRKPYAKPATPAPVAREAAPAITPQPARVEAPTFERVEPTPTRFARFMNFFSI